MSDNTKSENTTDRRDFLRLVGVTGATVSSLSPSEAASAAMLDDHKAQSRVSDGCNTNEAAFIESVVDTTLIPADPVGPGAAELGVAIHMDRHMAGSYGSGDWLFLEGSFARISVADDSF